MTGKETFGATNINGVVGNGSLTAFSSRGELAVLRRPSPIYYDQLNYKTNSDPDTCSLPRMEASENEGVFLGLICSRDYPSGPTVEVTWLRDSPWKCNQHYLDENTDISVNRFSSSLFGLGIAVTTFTLPQSEVLIQNVRIQKPPDSPIPSHLVLFENFVTDDDEDGEKEFQTRVAIPPIWEAALNYPSLMTFHSPEEFEPDELQSEDADAGCDCRHLERPASPDPLSIRRTFLALTFFAVLIYLLWKGNRRTKGVKGKRSKKRVPR